jgi:hypothetical protein
VGEEVVMDRGQREVISRKQVGERGIVGVITMGWDKRILLMLGAFVQVDGVRIVVVGLVELEGNDGSAIRRVEG